jgi:CBS domain-containing protein
MEEIAQFLVEHPPFNLLSYEQVRLIAERTQIEYFAAGKDILVEGGRQSAFLYIIRRGSVDVLREDAQGVHVLDTYGEGDFFGSLSLIRKQPPVYTVRTREEMLAYLIPARQFEHVLRENPEVADFFTLSKVKRLDKALQAHQEQNPSELFRLRMHDLMRKALMVEPYTSVRTTAQRMREIDTSCAVVTTEPIGILSDRDLRNRVVAEGLSESTHAARVMTSPVLTLSAESLAFEGLMMMLERNIHHVPVTRDGQIVGVVTHTDLLREQSRSPLLLPRMLEQARTHADLQAYSNQVELTAWTLLQSGAQVSDIGHMVAIAHDSLLKRVVSDAEEALGKPPCPYTWLVLGSQGRLEQTIRTDQDNAIVYADDAPQWADVYFRDLAQQVVDTLVMCGFPRCPGDIMATNQRWRQPVRVWKNYFEDWIARPDEEALMWAATFFDYRSIAGTLDVEPELRPVIRQARGQKIFLARMTRAALRQSPPLGFFRNFVLERSGPARDLIDLKQRGVALIVDLARVYALEAGSAETNTMSRLKSAAQQASLSKQGAEELISAFELISLYRLRHQFQQKRANEEVTNHLHVSQLSKLEQRNLKEALRAIGDAQNAAEHTFQTGSLG